MDRDVVYRQGLALLEHVADLTTPLKVLLEAPGLAKDVFFERAALNAQEQLAKLLAAVAHLVDLDKCLDPVPWVLPETQLIGL